MTRRGSLSICFVVASACCVGASPAYAQTAAGEITGVVHDQVGAAVPGATITVTETRTNLQRVVVSTRDGVYTAASLAPGEYRLDVELAGFKPMRREGIRLATGEKARVDFDLSVGDIREQVTVVALDAPIVRAETASLGTVVENEQVVQLPLNGRLFIMLAAIAPGVALPPNSVLPRINGGRPRTNEYLFDGISVLQPEPGQLAYYPVVDAIQEFKIESNSPPAEFGRFNGGVVNLTTKSGGNAFHGNVFEFFRNEHLNARNFFQRANPVKPQYRRNQYGGMLGGPLVRTERSSSSIIRASARASAGQSPRRCRPLPSGKACSGRTSTIRRRLSAPRASRFPTTRFRGAPWIPSRCRSSSATRCRHPPRPPIITAGPPTRSTIRSRPTYGSIISSRQAGISCSDA